LIKGNGMDGNEGYSLAMQVMRAKRLHCVAGGSVGDPAPEAVRVLHPDAASVWDALIVGPQVDALWDNKLSA